MCRALQNWSCDGIVTDDSDCFVWWRQDLQEYV